MSIQYLAVLDHGHLDNGLFLTSFARAIASHQHRGLILHSDSAYTDRIIQTGVMREEAKVRAVKDLNHRLIALLADHGVSAIGINGYQREMISQSNDNIKVDKKKFDALPEQPVLIISTLIHSADSDQPMFSPIADVAAALKTRLNIDDMFLFTRSEEDDIIKKELPGSLSQIDEREQFIRNNVPEEFQDKLPDGRLITASEFGKYPNIENATRLRE